MADAQIYPENIIDFLTQYSFADKDQHYTNGCRLIPVFRVAEALEHYFPEHFEVEPAEPAGGPHFTWIKDAERMFMDAGYYKVERSDFAEFMDVNGQRFRYEDGEIVIYDMGERFNVPVGAILACAQLVKEMEAQK